MTLEQQIRDLERQRRNELRSATYLFARTKRDVRRTLSPDRIIRRHIGVAMAAAAVGAMLLAPAPQPRRTKREISSAAPEHAAGPSALWGVLRSVLPQPLRHWIRRNGVEQSALESSPKQGKGLLDLLVAELAALAVRRLNLPGVLQQWMQRFKRAAKGEAAPGEPTVAVADAGTTPADQKFNNGFKS